MVNNLQPNSVQLEAFSGKPQLYRYMKPPLVYVTLHVKCLNFFILLNLIFEKKISVFGYTLGAETFLGRKFCEDKNDFHQ